MHDFARLANTLLKDEESLLVDKKFEKLNCKFLRKTINSPATFARLGRKAA